MGRSSESILAALGEPEMRRREPPVEVWQYRSDQCVFDVYFDAVNAGTGPVVVFYEARNRTEGTTEISACLRDVIAQDATQSTG